MPRSPDNQEPDARLVFDSGGFRYELYRTLVKHRDYDTLMVVWRQPVGGGPRAQILLKPLDAPHGRDRHARAREEVNLAMFLRHPNIAEVYGLAAHEGVNYVVSEHMRGCFLLTVMDAAMIAGHKLSPAFAASVAADVADALDYAHDCEDDTGQKLHIIHRAVGPLRIRLSFTGRVKLTNFGAAYSELRHRLPTPLGVLRGDPAYIAPEILRAATESQDKILRSIIEPPSDPLTAKGIDGRADIFSLGLVLLEMLTGEYPLDPLETLTPRLPSRFPPNIVSERPTWIKLEVLANRVLRFGPAEVERAASELPTRLQAILMRALQPTPAERFESAAEMRNQLRLFLLSLAEQYTVIERASELKAILQEASRRWSSSSLALIERGVLPLRPGMMDSNPSE
jgi:serine/threonine-protein kinase